MRTPWSPELTERTNIDTARELPFRLRVVERLKAGLSEPLGFADFDPYVERTTMAVVSGRATRVRRAWFDLENGK